MKVLSLIPAGDGCGWGVAGSNIAKALPQYCELVTMPESCDAVLAPLNNEKWGYVPGMESIIYRARELRKPIIGYGFHEYDIHGTSQIHYLPQNYTALACGSTWMTDWVKAALHDVAADFPIKPVFQGVDRSLFGYRKPEKPEHLKNRFVISAFGKFEFRKSPDVIIEAFRRFKKQTPEAMLLINFDNPWVNTVGKASDYEYKCDVDIVSDGQSAFISGVSDKLIAKEDQMTFRAYGEDMKPIWSLVPNSVMPGFWANADIALFPNRCEAGQSLCAAEAVASGIPSILMDEHGMRDLCDVTHGTACTYLEGSKKKSNALGHYWEPCQSEILSELMRLYRQRTTEEERVQISNSIPWTWDDTAKQLVNLCKEVA